MPRVKEVLEILLTAAPFPVAWGGHTMPRPRSFEDRADSPNTRSGQTGEQYTRRVNSGAPKAVQRWEKQAGARGAS